MSDLTTFLTTWADAERARLHRQTGGIHDDRLSEWRLGTIHLSFIAHPSGRPDAEGPS